MRTRFEPMRPWTRSHEKFAKAWGELQNALGRLGVQMAGDRLGSWLHARWGVHTIRELRPAQARAGCRQLNAWRASVERRCDGYREYPRQVRRNYRRHLLRTLSPPDGDYAAHVRRVDARVTTVFGARSADKTASTQPEKFENLIAGTPLAGLGRLMPSES